MAQYNIVSEGNIETMTDVNKSNLQWFRIEGKSRKDAENYALRSGASICSHNCCASLRFCEANQTQNGLARCCREQRTVSYREQTQQSSGGDSSNVVMGVNNVFKERRQIMALAVQEIQQDIKQYHQESIWSRLTTKAKSFLGINTTTKAVLEKANLLESPSTNISVEEPCEDDFDTQPSSFAPTSFVPTQPSSAGTPPVEDKAEAETWNPLSLLMNNGQIILNDKERKSQILHISFIAPTRMIFLCL
ncbi:MAG: hypothetical protein P1U85_21185 [Verrucomicrobiales bacterium]|nr:hypothetical protein [Verrucomicrobiales bacterium]